MPLLSGSGTLSVYGGLSGAGGANAVRRRAERSGSRGCTGTGSIGGNFAVDGGRTIENDGILDWSSGNIMLGQGDRVRCSSPAPCTTWASCMSRVRRPAGVGAGGAA